MVDSGDIAPKILDVLDDPNLDKMLEQPWVSERLKSILQDNSQHTLAAASYPLKYQRVTHARDNGLRIVKRIWVLLGVAFACGGIVAVCVMFRYWGAYVVLCLLAILFAV